MRHGETWKTETCLTSKTEDCCLMLLRDPPTWPPKPLRKTREQVTMHPESAAGAAAHLFLKIKPLCKIGFDWVGSAGHKNKLDS